MAKRKTSRQPHPQQLLVEGMNDLHVISALCHKYQVPQTFSIELPNENKTQGVEALLLGLPIRLKEPYLKTLGIVVDADQDLQARWQAISNKLKSIGYDNIPKNLCSEGWIYEQTELPKIGVWIMPNNQLTGKLEDFVSYLIPDDDQLQLKANEILNDLETLKINGYNKKDKIKAFIHTWLAWQKKPGIQMGQAITANILKNNPLIAEIFINWLNQLYQ
ncbi:hypothetical protein cce_4218 [Crocosphaera subtropica ATCC 51142]|uniref:DUF4435 domain-containing protein n=1 Tax=Crocosphaera subtropica (strain ATCC 51142 / BH68) TaxID=43989 RepID=B1WSI7_CROS5|nr:DUF3226 domain-containing protein [Crocosphaera subtropica]ACB53566.1 hypothetical protein cce_4218 [Crocosphaera subtropica ATCC 51142]